MPFLTDGGDRDSVHDPGWSCRTVGPQERCRGCGGSHLLTERLVDLPLPRAYAATDLPLTSCYPTLVSRCLDCSLVQLAGALPRPGEVARSVDRPSIRSRARIAAAHRDAEHLMGMAGNGHRTLIGIGSTDGYRLSPFRRAGWETIGFEPAATRAGLARISGIPTIQGPFQRTTAELLVGRRRGVDLVLCHTILGRVDDPAGFLAAVRGVVGPEGAAIVRIPRILEHIRDGEVWRFDHESPTYFTLRALDRVAHRAGLGLETLRVLPPEAGGQLEVRLRPDATPDGSITARLALEERLERQAWEVPLVERREEWALEFRGRLADRLSTTQEVLGVGASREASTKLAIAGVTTSQSSAVADINPFKIGMVIPSS